MDYPKIGGTTDRSNYNASKEIVSKNIVEFTTRFYIAGQNTKDDLPEGLYGFAIRRNEQGNYILTCSGMYQHEMVISDQVLPGVQDIIDRYELVKKNGGRKITAGLPAAYEPWLLNVQYDSGETLYFYETGNPHAEWTVSLRKYFIEIMADARFEDVLPQREALAIERFSMAFDKDGISHFYSIMQSAGKEKTYLDYYSVNMGTNEIIEEKTAEITKELYIGLQEIVAKKGIDKLHKPESVHFNLKKDKAGFLEIYIDYENGRQIYGEYCEADLPAEWPEMKEALMDYFDRCLWEKNEDKTK